MDEMYFDLKKGEYIKVICDELEIKRTYFDAYGILHKNEIVRDKIRNFTLVYFKISLKVDIIMNLINEEKNYFDHIVCTVGKQNAKEFEIFKDLMAQYGRFENRSKHDVYYGDYTIKNMAEQWREKEFSEDQKEQEQISDEEIFYKKIKELPGFDAPTEKEEINYLRTVLRENEQVIIAVSGSMEVGIGLLVCTDQRILFLKSAMFSGMNCLEIMLDKINSVSCGGGLSVGKVIIQDGAGKHEISSMKKEASELFAKIVRDTMHEQKKEEKVVAQNQTASTADELLKYKQLLDMGAITEEEFTKLKSDLIK